jgi:glycosyltransferase involved in cell wall biosynthesis
MIGMRLWPRPPRETVRRAPQSKRITLDTLRSPDPRLVMPARSPALPPLEESGAGAVASAPSSSGPGLAVLVIAHDRRKFLLEAVRSVLAQRKESVAVEIVVVKNFDDPEIDRNLDGWGVPRIQTVVRPLGATLQVGAGAASAPVLTFLEDDDLYEPDRLVKVNAAFAAHPRLGYYHNRVRRFFDPVAATGALAADRRGSVVGPRLGWLPDAAKNRAVLDHLFWEGAGFNLSAIAVRREVLDVIRGGLAQIEMSASLALYFAASLGDWDLYFDPTPLTGFRMHPDNWSVTPVGSRQARWRKSVRNALTTIRDARRITRMIEEDPRHRVSAAPVRAIEARNELVLRMGGRDRSRGAILGALARCIARLPARAVWDQRGLVGASVAGVLQPGLLDRWLGAPGKSDIPEPPVLAPPT